MATVVFNAAIAWGDVFPLVPVARRLVQAGHAVRFVVPSGFHEALGGLGFDVRPAGYELSPRELAADPELDSDRWAGMHWGRRITRHYLLPHARAAFEALDEAAADADLLVTQQTLPFVRTVAEYRRLPWATFVVIPMAIPTGRSMRAAHKDPVSAAGRRLAYRAGDLAWRGWLGGKQVHRLRRELGLRPIRESIPTAGISPRLVIVAHSPLFVNRPSDWPAHVRLTGQSPWDWPAERTPAGLRDFLHSAPPPVTVTLGSAPTAGTEQLLTGLAADLRAAGRRGLFLVRGWTGPSMFGPGIGVYPGAPLHDVLASSAAVVHKGGYGTTTAALEVGCPMVIIGRQFEHRWYGARVRELGIGLPAPWRPPAAVQRVTGPLATVLGDPAFRDRAAALARRLATEDGPGNAAKDLLELATVGAGAAAPHAASRP
jgi:sterol 3beta-glucosyltransferase